MVVQSSIHGKEAFWERESARQMTTCTGTSKLVEKV
jgi:hypothetical protein